jgi:hypothetical protein
VEVGPGVGDGGFDFGGIGGDDQSAGGRWCVAPVVFCRIGDLAEAKFEPVDQRLALGGRGFGVEMVGGGVGVIAQLPINAWWRPR